MEQLEQIYSLFFIERNLAREDGGKHAILQFEMKFPKEKFVLIGVYSWFKPLFGCGYAALCTLSLNPLINRGSLQDAVLFVRTFVGKVI